MLEEGETFHLKTGVPEVDWWALHNLVHIPDMNNSCEWTGQLTKLRPRVDVTIHFRFGHAHGEYIFDLLRVSDMSDDARIQLQNAADAYVKYRGLPSTTWIDTWQKILHVSINQQAGAHGYGAPGDNHPPTPPPPPPPPLSMPSAPAGPYRNDNVLDGLSCPNCRSLGPYKIAGKAFFDVTDDGTGDVQDVEWDGTDFCQCKNCEYTGTVNDFCIGSTEHRRLAVENAYTILTWIQDYLYRDDETGEVTEDKEWDSAADFVGELDDKLRRLGMGPETLL